VRPGKVTGGLPIRPESPQARYYREMRIFSFLFFLLGGALFAQLPAPPPRTPSPIGALPSGPPPTPQPFDKVILTVGDEKMTVGEYEKFIDTLPDQYKAAARGPAKRQVVEHLVDLKVMAHEATKRKLDQDPAYKAQLAFQAENLLAGTLYREMSTSLKIDEADLRKYYDEHKSEYESAQAKHILIRFKGSSVPKGDKPELSEEEALAKAKALRVRLVAGEDFATMAKAESDDSGSGKNGGDLGSFSHGHMVKPFEDAAFALPIGQVSEPVKTQFGYHLILVQKHEIKTFDEVRAEIEKKLRPEKAKQAVSDLRKQASVMIDESFFGPAPAAK
jgi:peptidyl-prolyl cis-trans isomerase C